MQIDQHAAPGNVSFGHVKPSRDGAVDVVERRVRLRQIEQHASEAEIGFVVTGLQRQDAAERNDGLVRAIQGRECIAETAVRLDEAGSIAIAFR
jgi:hypothetical protein